MINNQYHYAFVPVDVEQDDRGHQGHDSGSPCHNRAANAYWQEPLEAGHGSESVQYDPRSIPMAYWVEGPNQPWNQQSQSTPQPYFYQRQDGAAYNEPGASHVADIAMGNCGATNDAWMPNVPQGGQVCNDSESNLESMGVSAGRLVLQDLTYACHSLILHSFQQESTLKQYAVHRNEQPLVPSQRSHEHGQLKARKKSKHSSKTYKKNHPKEAKARIESCNDKLYDRFGGFAVNRNGSSSASCREETL